MTDSHHVVPAEIFTLLGELLFQLHGGLLVEDSRKFSPRTVRVIAGMLARLESEETLPEDFRALCDCLHQDWRDCGKPVAHGCRIGMDLCAA